MKRKFILLVVLLISVFASAQSQQLTIATYNVRQYNKGDSVAGNGWRARYPVIARQVLFHDFDIFGTQEAFYHQLTNLKDSLPGYAFIGKGRDDGNQKGEHSAIFYKTDKYKVLDQGTFWLSETTDKPNKGWDAMFPRVCTWGMFQEKKSGFKFYMFNLHMDHVGVVARRESAKLILKRIKDMIGNTPVILTGDFNVDQFNESYTLLNTSGVLKDAFTLAPIKLAEMATFNSYSVKENSDKRIDHIFVTKHFKVLRYGILTDVYNGGRTPSDHFPVMVKVTY